MRNIWVLFIEVLLVICLWIGAYSIYRRSEARRLSHRTFVTSNLYLSNPELEEELIFFLARHLGIYDRNYEIVDVVNLNTRELVGADYILVTLRAPDGRLCQITVSRDRNPWAKWELNPENFEVIEVTESGAAGTQAAVWMRELGITPEQVDEYCKAHPEIIEETEAAFLDIETGKHRLPADWYQAVKIEKSLRLEIGRDKTIRLISSMEKEAKARVVNSYWKSDYPEEYLGPGYREYLYRKIKAEQ